MIKLIGILIIIVGFVLKLDTLAVVLIAGIVTGLVAGVPFHKIVEILGKAFVDNRYMSIFIISLPVIGILERYGLRERAAYVIGKIKAATVGKVTSLYLALRTLAAMFGLRLGGHVQFIRPLILPMAEGAAMNRYGEIKSEDHETIKGLEAAVENYGNFFGQNAFVAAGGVLLIVGVLKELNYTVEALDIAKASIPIALIIMVVGTLQFFYYDRKFDQKYGIRTRSKKENR
ncbi:DUF969 domain-containing protein [Thermoanaerobacter brockii subsp. lactiethylicus]|jgi:uncharacterized membrane protein|uniref:DUF969 domain-containing protein n=1 Tax=unclassified Thermoanaerobacter TaxID=2636821 RepID=UPI0000E1DEC5|nr:DUF969 domain-containing protein [Thermoanaerobacter sp. X514]ABY92662.1 protein of unknown function DUF969 [Thermoanaerobacter sp. X514]